jgi:polysaccharide pyruvyl transferase WcaK-like protein
MSRVTCTPVDLEQKGAVSLAPKYRTIGLLDHMGFGNMGDAAIHESFILNIVKRLPNARLVAFSQNPEDTRTRHNIVSYPIEWNYPGRWNGSDQPHGAHTGVTSTLKSLLEKRCDRLYRLARYLRNLGRKAKHLKRSYDAVKSLDLLVIAGGGQLCELWGGAWSHPYNVFIFCILAKLAGTPVFIVGVGADLLERPMSKFFAKWSVRLADYTSFRSVESRDRIRMLGVKKETQVCPDPAYAVDVRRYLVTGRLKTLRAVGRHTLGPKPVPCALAPVDCLIADAPSTPRIKVGLNPMGFCDPRVWPRKDIAIYSTYLDQLARFSAWLLSRNYSIELFTSDMVVDRYALDDTKLRVLGAISDDLSDRVVCRPALNLDDLLLQMATFDFVVTSKFHGVIFSHLLGKPVIALSYLPKIDHLMNMVGQGRYCLEIEGLDANSLIGAFDSLVREADEIKCLFRRTAACYADALQASFDSLFGAKSQTVSDIPWRIRPSSSKFAAPVACEEEAETLKSPRRLQ